MKFGLVVFINASAGERSALAASLLRLLEY